MNAATVCCGLDNRGVANANGKLFVDAARREDGGARRQHWREGALGTTPDRRGLQGGPRDHVARLLVYKNLVVTGFAEASTGVRGLLRGVQA